MGGSGKDRLLGEDEPVALSKESFERAVDMEAPRLLSAFLRLTNGRLQDAEDLLIVINDQDPVS